MSHQAAWGLSVWDELQVKLTLARKRKPGKKCNKLHNRDKLWKKKRLGSPGSTVETMKKCNLAQVFSTKKMWRYWILAGKLDEALFLRKRKWFKAQIPNVTVPQMTTGGWFWREQFHFDSHVKKKNQFLHKKFSLWAENTDFFKFDALFTFHDNCVLCPYRLLVTVFKIFALFLFKPLTIP